VCQFLIIWSGTEAKLNVIAAAAIAEHNASLFNNVRIIVCSALKTPGTFSFSD
jgi:hypothetical protein